MATLDHNRQVIRSLIEDSVLNTVEYILIYQSLFEGVQDSIVTVINLEWSGDENRTWFFGLTRVFSGVTLRFDSFVVNTFMLISGEPFLVMAVDNFGFIVIDLVSNTAIEEVNFRKFYPSINDFSILKLVPIAENGIRVIMQDGGAFSFIWRGLSKKYIQYFYRESWRWGHFWRRTDNHIISRHYWRYIFTSCRKSWWCWSCTVSLLQTKQWIFRSFC